VSPRLFLVLMTLLAVASDSLLHPFYPQYFLTVFGVTDEREVGVYIALCSLTVLLCLPAWALLARRVHVLRLLVASQALSAALSLGCYAATSLTEFWIVSLGMMAFKASYLLIYPYLMSIDDEQRHISTISLLAFVVHFGGIASALLSGAVFQWLEARVLFVAMAFGDVLQMLLCWYWLARRTSAEASPAPCARSLPWSSLYRLGLVMLVVYFSAYLTEPFLSPYWEAISELDNKLLSGAVFAIPGAAALLGLLVNARAEQTGTPYGGIVPAIALGVCGLCLQMSGVLAAILLGRFLYGWALFQATVRLDLLLFRLSTPGAYALDFGKINLFQGLGVLLAASAAGSVVSWLGMRATFVIAGFGFALAAVLYWALFREQLRAAGSEAFPPATVGNGRAA